jgi:nucleotide-binding universal stress UspA family protein
MGIQRIALGINGSPESAGALAWAADLALSTGAEVVAVHAFELAPYLPGRPGLPYVVAPRAVANALLHGVEDEWCAQLRQSGVAYRAVLRDGSAGVELLRVATEESADLIVVGSRGRNALREALLGSVAHHVTHHASCPVVVVVVPSRVALAMGPAPTSFEAS